MRQRIPLLAAACGLAAAGLTAGPAHATGPTEPVFSLAGPAPIALTPHPATGSPQTVALAYRLERPAASSVAFEGEFTFTVDLARIAGVATVREKAAATANGAATANRCTTPTPTTLVCTDKGPRQGAAPGIDLEAFAAAGAADGAAGQITVTGTAPGATVRPVATAIQVGGPDLVMGAMNLKRDPNPGESQPLPLAFRNNGTQPAKGVVLELEATRGMEFVERYDNCVYRAGRTSTKAVCTVEGDFEAKSSYELAGDSPLHLKATGHALTEQLGYGIYPGAGSRPNAGAATPEESKTAESGQSGQSGQATPGGSAENKKPADGRKLTARKRAAELTPALRGPDLNPADNRRTFDFAVRNTADFAADVLSVKGKAGTTVKAAVAVRNLGPAWVYDPRSEAPAAVAEVLLPKGVTATKAPAACRPATTGDTSRYLCATGRSVLESERIEFPFELRIDKVVPDAKGAVTVGAPGPQGAPQRHAFDPVLVNNLGLLVANPTRPVTPTPGPTGATPTPSGSATASPSPSTTPSGGATPNGGSSTGSGGGRLASTGSTALLVGGAGAALVAAGGALYLAFRRRTRGAA
ncbi:hypothetical protein OOK31_13540 [Streptomyces sp. NBC_00249]|uniref:hypothetical protein n=1 Tax=Streptomyces sp. NBC_00249 TaxID=2975690 RepID=UPI0022508D93|nr:hypothetical protein [Streptomyces sp. NBC_00249]MCX5194912.1 hypothetical protein [Streptomyces sp. NBC_00249]